MQPHHPTQPILPQGAPPRLDQYLHLGASERLAAELSAVGLDPDIIVDLDHFAAASFVSDDPDEWPDNTDDIADAIGLTYPRFTSGVLERAALAPWDFAALTEWLPYGGTLARILDIWGAGIGPDHRELLPRAADCAAIVTAAQGIVDTPPPLPIEFDLDDIRFRVSGDGLNMVAPDELAPARALRALGGEASPALVLVDGWDAATRVLYPTTLAAAMKPLRHLLNDGTLQREPFQAAYQVRRRLMAQRAIALAEVLPTWEESFVAEHADNA